MIYAIYPNRLVYWISTLKGGKPVTLSVLATDEGSSKRQLNFQMVLKQKLCNIFWNILSGIRTRYLIVYVNVHDVIC